MKAFQFVTGEFTGMVYKLIVYQDGAFTFSYEFDGRECISGREYETATELIKAINKRELSLSIGDTVMF